MAWNPDWHLERYGKLLKMLVRGMGLDPRLRRRFDDLVQETLLKAHASKHQFQGDQAQLVQWLKKMVENSLGGPPSKVEANYVKASPITYARKCAAPLLLIHGSNDTFVPVDQSQTLKQKMDLVGADVQMITVDHAPHDFETGADANARIAAAATWAYLEHHLKKRSVFAEVGGVGKLLRDR